MITHDQKPHQSYIWFHNSLFNHRYMDETLYVKIEPFLWQRVAFGENGIYYLKPEERGLENEGSKIFEDIIQNETARILASWNGTQVLQ